MRVGEESPLEHVVQAEVRAAVNQDASERRVEAAEDARNAVRTPHSQNAVRYASELALLRRGYACVEHNQQIMRNMLIVMWTKNLKTILRLNTSHVGSETSARKVERIEEDEGNGTSGAARSDITSKIPPETRAVIDASKEKAFELVV